MKKIQKGEELISCTCFDTVVCHRVRCWRSEGEALSCEPVLSVTGAAYKGTTVLLDSDIDFTVLSDQFTPSEKGYFTGLFDGQWHIIISNLKLRSEDKGYYGLFRYSLGATFMNGCHECIVRNLRNFVLGEGALGAANIGAVFGYCEYKKSACNIENCINTGKVSFKKRQRWDDSAHGRGGGLVGSILWVCLGK